MTPMIEFRSTDQRRPGEAVSFDGDVRVGFSEVEDGSEKLSILTLVLPSDTVTTEVDRACDELRPDDVIVNVYSGPTGKAIDLKSGRVLPDGFKTKDPINSQMQVNIRTAIKKS